MAFSSGFPPPRHVHGDERVAVDLRFGGDLEHILGEYSMTREKNQDGGHHGSQDCKTAPAHSGRQCGHLLDTRLKGTHIGYPFYLPQTYRFGSS
jgi:hypothetical protein